MGAMPLPAATKTSGAPGASCGEDELAARRGGVERGAGADVVEEVGGDGAGALDGDLPWGGGVAVAGEGVGAVEGVAGGGGEGEGDELAGQVRGGGAFGVAGAGEPEGGGVAGDDLAADDGDGQQLGVRAGGGGGAARVAPRGGGGGGGHGMAPFPALLVTVMGRASIAVVR